MEILEVSVKGAVKRASEMAQWVKKGACRQARLRPNSGIYAVEGENLLVLRLSSDLHIPHASTHSHRMNKPKESF